jgi:hypothetical protein
MHSAFVQRIKRVYHFIVDDLALIFGFISKMLFHSFLKLVFVHASKCIDVVCCRIGTDFKFLEELRFDLLSENLAMMFNVLEIDSTDELLALHLTHFLLFIFLLYRNRIFFYLFDDIVHLLKNLLN